MKKTTKKRNRMSRVRGFTLIELLVVMVIIGVLSTLGVSNYIEARIRARDAQRKANLAQIQSALELYRADRLTYPTALPACNAAMSVTVSGVTTTFMRKNPCDPSTSAVYIYRPLPAAAPTTYTLVACLENANDANRDATRDASCAIASYTLTNP